MLDKLALDELSTNLREEITRRVAEGFASEDFIVDSITEYALDNDEADLDEDAVRDLVARLTAESIQEHRRRQSEWVGPTDCDRLDQAFAELEMDGIVARQNFSCCQNCGHAEIGGEISAAEGPVDGYTFYHLQDTESAVETGFLYLAYGATDNGGEAVEAVGRRIAAALERAGLTVEWNGSRSQRIGVHVEWRRRRA